MEYSETAADHYRHPRNVGLLAEANARGFASDDENRVTLYLLVVEGVVRKAQFRALACNACVAAASMSTVLLLGRSLDEAATLGVDSLLKALGGLPAAKVHCAALAVDAVRAALVEARELAP